METISSKLEICEYGNQFHFPHISKYCISSVLSVPGGNTCRSVQRRDNSRHGGHRSDVDVAL